jgi:formylglycine-generating enzyme required for sulfatase activity
MNPSIPFQPVAQRSWRIAAAAGAVGGLLAIGAPVAQAQSAAAESQRVQVGPLLVDRTEVTIGQFVRFAQATGTVTRAEREGGGFEYVGGWQRRPGWTWRTPDGVPPVSSQLPAVHLTHAEAEAYCRWAGGRLPTAAEWASAAYTEQRNPAPAPWVRGTTYPYPTGNTPQGANTSGADAWPRAAPAGATAEGVNGLFDMGANAWEWVSDAQGAERRTMGGSWWYGPGQMRKDVNAWKAADFYAVYIGFRCVAAVN